MHGQTWNALLLDVSDTIVDEVKGFGKLLKVWNGMFNSGVHMQPPAQEVSVLQLAGNREFLHPVPLLCFALPHWLLPVRMQKKMDFKSKTGIAEGVLPV